MGSPTNQPSTMGGNAGDKGIGYQNSAYGRDSKDGSGKIAPLKSLGKQESMRS
jgi:hypothetical protein